MSRGVSITAATIAAASALSGVGMGVAVHEGGRDYLDVGLVLGWVAVVLAAIAAIVFIVAAVLVPRVERSDFVPVLGVVGSVLLMFVNLGHTLFALALASD
jgi:hypothetical protein